MSASALAVQGAIFAALDGTLTCPVYDDVPRDAAEPYVVIDSSMAQDRSSKTTAGEEHTVTLSIWSVYGGRKEVKSIAAEIYTALHNQSLSVSGFDHVMTRFISLEDFLDADGVTRHGVVTLRILTNASS